MGRSGGIEWGAQLLSCLELQYFLQRYEEDGEKVSRDEHLYRLDMMSDYRHDTLINDPHARLLAVFCEKGMFGPLAIALTSDRYSADLRSITSNSSSQIYPKSIYLTNPRTPAVTQKHAPTTPSYPPRRIHPPAPPGPINPTHQH